MSVRRPKCSWKPEEVGLTQTGTIVSLIPKKTGAFGFISVEHNGIPTDVYFNHQGIVQGIQFNSLNMGSSVLFEAKVDSWGNSLATNVRTVDSAEGGKDQKNRQRTASTESVSSTERARDETKRLIAANMSEWLDFLESKGLTPEQLQAVEKSIQGTDQYVSHFQMRIVERLQQGDIVVRNEGAVTTTFFTAFNKFVKKVPAWTFTENSATAALFYLHDDNKMWSEDPEVMVLRKQTYSNCYMHAPVTLVHYHIAKSTVGRSKDMANLGLIEASKSGSELYELIMNMGGSGGASLTFLKQLVYSQADHVARDEPIQTLHFAIGSGPEDKLFTLVVERVREHLGNGFPALVSEFAMEKTFYDGANTERSFRNLTDDFVTREGPNGEAVPQTHSMVALGFRVDEETNDTFILCQNWHPGKYFVEFSATYLRQCRAKFSFLFKPVSKYPDKCPTTTGLFFETCVPEPESPPVVTDD